MVSVNRAVADSKPPLDNCTPLRIDISLRLDIEDPEHDFISRVSNHPAGLRIYFSRDVTAQFEELNADAI
jgi:hypothetical protein